MKQLLSFKKIIKNKYFIKKLYPTGFPLCYWIVADPK